MIKHKMYKYIGYNGVITSSVLLPNIDHLVFYDLEAAIGYYLTDGQIKAKRASVLEEDLYKWTEVEGTID